MSAANARGVEEWVGTVGFVLVLATFAGVGYFWADLAQLLQLPDDGALAKRGTLVAAGAAACLMLPLALVQHLLVKRARSHAGE